MIHREWFRPVSLGNRKSCPECKAKLPPGESIWSWGEYQYAKWRTVQYLCRSCWPAVEKRLLKHRLDCGCDFELVGYHTTLPAWLALPTTEQALCSVS